MDRNWYLFSFEGRINRAKYWLSFPILVGWMLLIMWIMWLIMITALLVTRAPHGQDTINVSFGINEIVTLLGRASHLSLSSREIVSLAGNLFGITVFMWICLATSVKRLHDRDRSGSWIVPFFVLANFSRNIQEWLGDSIFSFLIGLALFILCIWGFIELGFLRGTRRINRFGPDPLAEDEDARLRRSGLGSSGPAWDQQREVELAPTELARRPACMLIGGHE
jgi:uncharacterized membrane protein YhaH (DUF805 family)